MGLMLGSLAGGLVSGFGTGMQLENELQQQQAAKQLGALAKNIGTQDVPDGTTAPDTYTYNGQTSTDKDFLQQHADLDTFDQQPTATSSSVDTSASTPAIPDASTVAPTPSAQTTSAPATVSPPGASTPLTSGTSSHPTATPSDVPQDAITTGGAKVDAGTGNAPVSPAPQPANITTNPGQANTRKYNAEDFYKDAAGIYGNLGLGKEANMYMAQFLGEHTANIMRQFAADGDPDAALHAFGTIPHGVKVAVQDVAGADGQPTGQVRMQFQQQVTAPDGTQTMKDVGASRIYQNREALNEYLGSVIQDPKVLPQFYMNNAKNMMEAYKLAVHTQLQNELMDKRLSNSQANTQARDETALEKVLLGKGAGTGGTGTGGTGTGTGKGGALPADPNQALSEQYWGATLAAPEARGKLIDTLLNQKPEASSGGAGAGLTAFDPSAVKQRAMVYLAQLMQHNTSRNGSTTPEILGSTAIEMAKRDLGNTYSGETDASGKPTAIASAYRQRAELDPTTGLYQSVVRDTSNNPYFLSRNGTDAAHPYFGAMAKSQAQINGEVLSVLNPQNPQQAQPVMDSAYKIVQDSGGNSQVAIPKLAQIPGMNPQAATKLFNLTRSYRPIVQSAAPSSAPSNATQQPANNGPSFTSDQLKTASEFGVSPPKSGSLAETAGSVVGAFGRAFNAAASILGSNQMRNMAAMVKPGGPKLSQSDYMNAVSTIQAHPELGNYFSSDQLVALAVGAGIDPKTLSSAAAPAQVVHLAQGTISR